MVRASAPGENSARRSSSTCRQQKNEKCAAGDRECAGAGWRNFLLHQRTGQRQDRDDHEETADQHGEAESGVVPRRVAGQAGEGAAVVAGAGTESVKNFAQAVRAVVVQTGQAPFAHDRPGGESENGQSRE